MADIIHELKHTARILQRNITTGKPESLRFIKKHPDLKKQSDQELIAEVKRKHCLTQIARYLGFKGWSHLSQVLSWEELPAPSEERSEQDYGKLLSPPRCYAYTNFWSAFYTEAKEHRDQTNGYLLCFGTQYFVTEEDFIRTLGLDPKASEWASINKDWAHPGDLSARTQLYQQLIRYSLKDRDWL